MVPEKAVTVEVGQSHFFALPTHTVNGLGLHEVVVVTSCEKIILIGGVVDTTPVALYLTNWARKKVVRPATELSLQAAIPLLFFASLIQINLTSEFPTISTTGEEPGIAV